MEAVGEIVSDEVTAGLHVAEASVEIAGEPVIDAVSPLELLCRAVSTAQLHLSAVASDASAAVQMAMAAARWGCARRPGLRAALRAWPAAAQAPRAEKMARRCLDGRGGPVSRGVASGAARLSRVMQAAANVPPMDQP